MAQDSSGCQWYLIFPKIFIMSASFSILSQKLLNGYGKIGYLEDFRPPLFDDSLQHDYKKAPQKLDTSVNFWGAFADIIIYSFPWWYK